MSLGIFRQKIDSIDLQILDLFQQRMDIVKEVAQYKISNNLVVLNATREDEILDTRSSQAKTEYRDDVKALFTELMRLSRKMQIEIIAKNSSDTL